MDAADAMYHLNAVARSVPELALPPDALNSQISGILRATQPFPDTDHDWILQNIELFQPQLSVYDALLDRINDVRLEIQHCRDAVHRSMVAYLSTLALIRRLPSEICRAVFCEVQISLWSNTEDSESESESEENPVLDFSQGPWKLSHVCGAWRDIVLSYPQLWSCIVLQSPKEMLDHRVPALQAMILCSAQHPLDIMFEFEVCDNEDVAIQAISVILDESYRWRSIELYLCLPLWERLKVVHGKIPCLESLTMKTVYIPSYSRQELPEEVQSMFIEAPHLQKVILHHTYGLGDFIFPHYITHLETCTSNVSNLEAYQSLVECRLVEKGPGPGFFSPHPIHLSNVRCLFVSSVHLLTYLHLPSLDDLMISRASNASGMDGVVLAMNKFVHRSRCTLTSLAIHNSVAFHQVFIKDCLLLMDSLVSLEIGHFWNEDVEVILGLLTSSNFLPNFQHLSLRVPYAQPSLWEPLTAMISSRSQYLHSIRISCGRADDVERVNEHLASLQLPGLSMVVSMNNVLSYFEIFESG